MRSFVALVLVGWASVIAVGQEPPKGEPPVEWVDASTGHRVVRLSREAGSASLYFHQNAYSPDGTKLVMTTPSGVWTVDLRTRELKQVVEGRVGVIVTGRKSGDVYYTRAGVVYATNLESRQTREVAKVPARGSIASVNADETLLLGSMTEGPGQGPGPGAGARGAAQPTAAGADGRPLTFAEQKEVRLNNRLEQRIPMAMFVIDTKSGEMRVVHRATDWLNHLQFSPTDPGLIMFCHEGPWHKVDRIWTIRVDGTKLAKVHTRTMNMQIAGHEFFGADGGTVWYDLQTPRGEDFWLAGYELRSGKRTWYHLQRDEWSVHFNVSPDGRLFAGDGGDEEMVAHAKDGKWIYLFRPEGIPDVAGIRNPQSEQLIDPGVLRAEKLVDMRKHDYRLEPNVTFTPDGKWVVFRSNMHGGTQVYAVEVEKGK